MHYLYIAKWGAYEIDKKLTQRAREQFRGRVGKLPWETPNI